MRPTIPLTSILSSQAGRSAKKCTGMIPNPGLFHQQLAKRFRTSHRRFAGEVFADVRGWFSFNQRHRTNGLVSFAEILLPFIRIGQNHNCVWEKMAMNFFE
jgi:hypothetical protein